MSRRKACCPSPQQGLHEPDQAAVVEGADPAQAVLIEPGSPRLNSGRWRVGRVGECSCMQIGEFPVVDVEADSVVRFSRRAEIRDTTGPASLVKTSNPSIGDRSRRRSSKGNYWDMGAGSTNDPDLRSTGRWWLVSC